MCEVSYLIKQFIKFYENVCAKTKAREGKSTFQNQRQVTRNFHITYVYSEMTIFRRPFYTLNFRATSKIPKFAFRFLGIIGLRSPFIFFCLN